MDTYTVYTARLYSSLVRLVRSHSCELLAYTATHCELKTSMEVRPNKMHGLATVGCCLGRHGCGLLACT
jgi:hypothetical protein